MSREFYLILAVVVVLFSGIVGLTYMHELVHVQNFKQGGVSSHVEFSLSGGLTVPENDFSSQKIADEVNLANSFNEAVAYNVSPLFFMLCGVIVICTIYLGGSKK